MNIKRLTKDFSTAPQPRPEDMAALAASGFRGVVCTRPDGEDAGQPAAAEMRVAAEAAGMSFSHIPIRPGEVTPAATSAMAAALASLPGPVLGYCRSGARAQALWQAARA